MLTSEEAATLAALNAKAAELVAVDAPAAVAGETAAEVGAAVAEAVGAVAATVAAVVAHEVSEAHEDAHEAVIEAARGEVAAAHEAEQLAAIALAAATVTAELDRADDDEPAPVVVVADELGAVDAPAEADHLPAEVGGHGHPWFRARHWGKDAL